MSDKPVTVNRALTLADLVSAREDIKEYVDAAIARAIENMKAGKQHDTTNAIH